MAVNRWLVDCIHIANIEICPFTSAICTVWPSTVAWSRSNFDSPPAYASVAGANVAGA
ncbi:MAG: hypothetical protein WCK65_06340 [Rhodospirillaceae bacterium]